MLIRDFIKTNNIKLSYVVKVLPFSQSEAYRLITHPDIKLKYVVLFAKIFTQITGKKITIETILGIDNKIHLKDWNLKQFMALCKVPRCQIQKQCGIGQYLMIKAMTDPTVLSVKQIQAIADFFHVKLGDLFTPGVKPGRSVHKRKSIPPRVKVVKPKPEKIIVSKPVLCIKDLMHNTGIKSRDLINILPLSQPSVWRLLNHKNPRLKHLILFADAISILLKKDVSPFELVGRQPSNQLKFNEWNLRRFLEITQTNKSDFADAIGISRSHLKYCCRKVPAGLTLETFKRIAVFFQCQIEDLFDPDAMPGIPIVSTPKQPKRKSKNKKPKMNYQPDLTEPKRSLKYLAKPIRLGQSKEAEPLARDRTRAKKLSGLVEQYLQKKSVG